MKLGAVVGFNGEALRSLDLKMSRRAGEIRSFGLSAKIGRDATLTGELRGRPGGRQVVVLQSTDAGALFRFTDVYSRMTGGQMAITMDAPSTSQSGAAGRAQRPQLHRPRRSCSLSARWRQRRAGRRSNSMDVLRHAGRLHPTAGRVALRDGVVRGPVLGGTIDGMVDYTRDEVHMRGTLIPLYGPTICLASCRCVGLFLGGEKEGLVGITYEVVGRPGNPVLHVNPLSALAPGLLRKVFEFPAASFSPADNVGTEQSR